PALAQYVECGGTLVISGSAILPATWKKETEEKKGTEEKKEMDQLGGWAVRTESPFAMYSIGFGKCLHSERAMSDWQFGEYPWEHIAESAQDRAEPWMNLQSSEQANSTFPVVADLSIPVLGLFFMMTFFAILIGPVNLWVLSRMQKRMWMLWTVPGISFL